MTTNTDNKKATACQKTPTTQQPQHSPLPERMLAEHPWPTSDKGEAIAVWRSAYVKALAEREAYKAHAEKLAEALRDIMPYAEGYKSSAGAIERATQAIAAYQSEVQS